MRVQYMDELVSIAGERKSAIPHNDRFRFVSLRANKKYRSRSEVRKLNDKTHLKQIAADWDSLTDAERQAWTDNATYMNLSGFALYTQQKSGMIKQGLTGEPTPSDYYHGRVCHVNVNSLPGLLQLYQEFRPYYYQKVKIEGKGKKFDRQFINFNPTYPIEYKIRVKSNLTVVGPDPLFRMRLSVWVAGMPYLSKFVYDQSIGFSSTWNVYSVNKPSKHGRFVKCSIRFHAVDVEGEFWFDDVELNTSGLNYARDPFCEGWDVDHEGYFAGIIENWTPYPSDGMSLSYEVMPA